MYKRTLLHKVNSKVADFVLNELLKSTYRKQFRFSIEAAQIGYPEQGENLVVEGEEIELLQELPELKYLTGFAHCMSSYELLTQPVIA